MRTSKRQSSVCTIRSNRSRYSCIFKRMAGDFFVHTSNLEHSLASGRETVTTTDLSHFRPKLSLQRGKVAQVGLRSPLTARTRLSVFHNLDLVPYSYYRPFWRKIVLGITIWVPPEPCSRRFVIVSVDRTVQEEMRYNHFKNQAQKCSKISYSRPTYAIHQVRFLFNRLVTSNDFRCNIDSQIGGLYGYYRILHVIDVGYKMCQMNA